MNSQIKVLETHSKITGIILENKGTTTFIHCSGVSFNISGFLKLSAHSLAKTRHYTIQSFFHWKLILRQINDLSVHGHITNDWIHRIILTHSIFLM